MDWKVVRKVLLDLFRVDNIDYPKCDVLTFACDNDRYIDLRGKKYSPLINTVEDALAEHGVTTTSITRIASVVKGEKSHGRVFSPEGAFARAMVSKRIKGKVFRSEKYPFSHKEKRVWERVVDQTEPRAVIGINPSRELCAVCKERGIWVADLQHGVIADTHPWYGANFRGSDPSQWAPDAFLVWDQGSAEVLEKWAPAAGAEIYLIGNPWVDRFRRKSDVDEVYCDLVKRFPLPENGKPNVLVSLTWFSYGIPNGHIHPALEQFILENIDVYNWYFRLHPNQLQGFATEEGRDFFKYFSATFPAEKIDWKLASAMPLPLLLSRTNIHVTWSSSVCMEAASFGIESLVMDPEFLPGGKRQDYYSYLADQGFICKISPEYEFINKWFESRPVEQKTPITDYSKNFTQLISAIAQRVNV